jgi:hypothetical protein
VRRGLLEPNFLRRTATHLGRRQVDAVLLVVHADQMPGRASAGPEVGSSASSWKYGVIGVMPGWMGKLVFGGASVPRGGAGSSAHAANEVADNAPTRLIMRAASDGSLDSTP